MYRRNPFKFDALQIMFFKKEYKKAYAWVILITAAIIIKVLSFFPVAVERYYTYGIYPAIAKIQRILLGWIPFSLGDIFYGLIIILLIIRAIRFFKNLKAKKFNRLGLYSFAKKMVFVLLVLFVTFYSLWGLNYSRVGIAGQLGLKEEKSSAKDLDTLVKLLHVKLNQKATQLQPAMRDSFRRHKNLFAGAEKAFDAVATKYPFLKYKVHSIKPSVFSYLGNYLGFQGYYNPFSGEAQVNTTMPQSVEPFVATHEIAHQLGYAKESEANFVGFLACREHPSIVYTYSVYFDMYHYAIREMYWKDSAAAAVYDSLLHPQVKKDIDDYRAFYKKYRNPIEPVISWAYGYFLKANNQPKGRESYNEVVNWLIAYYKKYGKPAI